MDEASSIGTSPTRWDPSLLLVRPHKPYDASNVAIPESAAVNVNLGNTIRKQNAQAVLSVRAGGSVTVM